MARKSTRAHTPKPKAKKDKQSKAKKDKQSKEKKSKQLKAKKNKQEIKITPRIRLEPRLTSSPLKKNKTCMNPENENSSFLEVSSIKSVPVLYAHAQDADVKNSCDPRNETSNMTLSAAEGNIAYETENNTIETAENEERDGTLSKTLGKSAQNKKKCAHKIYGGFEWSDRERMDLALALQVHGFSDIKKLAECVKTKKESNIEHFMRKRRQEACYNPNDKRINRQGNKFNSLHQHHLTSWPNVRKWRRIAHNQMLRYTRSKNYSKQVLSALCKRFYEEESEPTDPQAINVKSVYKFMASCMDGEVPAQLPPKESALVLDLLREVRSMPIAYDLEEERKFLQDFRTALKFKPFEVKDEFKKKIKKETPEEDIESLNMVQVPEQIFMELSRHKRLTQSFSPMVTPVWMLQKEQELLENYAAESNVYVD